ncbi:hypothetical protein EST38_g4493 [Candolleomyces aberdarensis]|uniref:ABC transporter domain-containing protein n=1 Tax=Candolleomyces aberdarensis TaxID=2316362 RepID=A0A4Q2DQV7_9AGAR|nr:hypothetical protein EST38_g4493 [Candolleomyces aberdarensis]
MGDLLVYACKVHNKDYLSKTGVSRMNFSKLYRKDIVAGNMGGLIWRLYQRYTLAVGDTAGVHRGEVENSSWYKKLSRHIRDPINALAQVYTCFQVINSPGLAPLSLASFQLVNSTAISLNAALRQLGNGIDQASRELEQLRQFYEFLEKPNKIKDGSTPFPENQADLRQGISVEFKNVSFSYTQDGKKFALRNVSFKIEQGQLCVIVGENGSGKSTILTLITRLYDITEGQILLNGVDLHTLKLDDVRKTIAVLFQEYTMYPLTLAENIGYGDPDNAEDMDMIQRAADLGGAGEFIESLPHKFSTYIVRPERDIGSEIASHGSVFEGKKVDFSKLKLNEDVSDFSGGQKQRIAL